MSHSHDNFIKAENGKHVLHPFSMPAANRETPPLIIADSEGKYVFDIDGKKYLDGLGGLWNVNIGHNHPEVKEAIIKQLDKLSYYNTFGAVSNPPSIELSAKIIDMLQPENMHSVFFSSGGSDAIESAIKLARQYWRLQGQVEKSKFISLKHGYHGVHFGGLSLNGMKMLKDNYGPLLPGFSQVDTPFLYRNPWTDDPEELARICAELLDREIDHQGAHTVAGFFAEPVQGAGGVIVPPETYWPLVREVCDKHNVLLIADEVVTGFGRTGSLFGARGWGVKPDIMAFAKGINAGYIPLGAIAANERVMNAWEEADPSRIFFHGYTSSGHPLACAAGVATLDIVEREQLHLNAGEVGAYCLSEIMKLKDKHEHLGDVRGKGLMVGLELVVDKESKTPVDPILGYSDALAAVTQREGVLVRSVGPEIIISPPLTFTTDDVDSVVSALDLAFSETPLPT